MTRVPRQDDPVHEVLSMDDFIIFMSAYWKFIKTGMWKKAGKKFTWATLFLLAVDYLRLRLLTWLL